MNAAVSSARVGYDRAIDLLERLVPIARRLERAVRIYAFVIVGAALVSVGTVLVVDLPGTVWTWGLVLAVLAMMLVAPVIILLFASMLREALELPGQFRSLPDVAPTRARELALLAREAGSRPKHERVGSIPSDSWRAGRLLNALRKEVPGVSVLLSIARVPFMIMVGVALLVGAFQIAMAPLVVLVAIVSTVI